MQTRPTVEQGNEWLTRCAAAGAMAGITHQNEHSVDGRSREEDMEDLNTLLDDGGLAALRIERERVMVNSIGFLCAYHNLI